MTSRSHRYYVSSAYWDRDSLLWLFPFLVRNDKALALDLSHFENAEYYDKLENARREADWRSLQIVNGGSTHTIDFDNAATIEDLLNTLNMSSAGVLAEINAAHTGIDIRSRLSGEDFMIGENGGTTAAGLGVRSFTTATRLEDLNYGFGVPDDESSGQAAEAHLGPIHLQPGKPPVGKTR